jgi:hypothetical protein
LSYIANSDLTIERAVKKNPKTDPSKASKGGILEVFKHGDEYVTKAYSTAFDPEVVAARTQSELKNIYYHSLEKRNISYPDFDQIVDRARA